MQSFLTSFIGTRTDSRLNLKLEPLSEAGCTVGLVIPTLGTRDSSLRQSLSSLVLAGNSFVSIVVPRANNLSESHLSFLVRHRVEHSIIEECGELSLSGAINLGLRSFPENVAFMGWLGDDDLLEPGALDLARQTLESDPDVVMVYGDCRYIDKDGNELFINRAGEKARRLLGYGPQLIPQPGALWRRDAFEAVGGLSADFDLAFDYDLFMKLKRHGKISYIPQTLASFRWHPDSLSVKQRWKSALEASRVRIRHHRGPERLLILLEPMNILATWVAGKLVTRFRLRPNQSNQSR